MSEGNGVTESATPPEAPRNIWAHLGLPASFDPTANGLFRVNKVDMKIVKGTEIVNERRYIVSFESPTGCMGLGFTEESFAEFTRQCQALRSPLILPGT